MLTYIKSSELNKIVLKNIEKTKTENFQNGDATINKRV